MGLMALKIASCKRIPDTDTLMATTACGAKFLVTVGVLSQPLTITALTPCCGASGKGSATKAGSVLCRKCYNEVNEVYGLVGQWGERTKLGEHFISLIPYDLILRGVQLVGCPCATASCVDHTLYNIEGASA